MNYDNFRRLLQIGESTNIDFKIKCDAFSHSRIAIKGELAKDICAMANNGNRASYIIVGVSDDGKSFRSVDNEKLIDDHVQDFSKKAIFPPPKIKVHRIIWKNALAAHKGKLFVIIQIGPNPRQVFRLSQDFINYKQMVCYRRNEVWIRRNATSDLATPEEITRLASGKPVEVDPERHQRQRDRDSFSRLSQNEQTASLRLVTENCLDELGYIRLPKNDWFNMYTYDGRGGLSYPTLWKKIRSIVILVCILPCYISLTKADLERISHSGAFINRFSDWRMLPSSITKLTRRRVRAVRRIWLVPSIRQVPPSRIATVFSSSRRLGAFLHYYQPNPQQSKLRLNNEKSPFITSSSELLILDKIKSLPVYEDALIQTVQGIEEKTETLVVPKMS